MPAFCEAGAGEFGVIAPIEPQGLDVGQQATLPDIVQGRCEQDGVVAVVPFCDPANWHSADIGGHRPLPSGFAPFGRVGSPVPSPPHRSLCREPVERENLGEVQPDHLVERLDGLFDQMLECTGLHPLARRRRRVVSPLAHLPATSQEHPVTSRNKMASKQSRSEIRGR